MILFKNAFPDLKNRIRDGSYIFLGLDYDGTLIELVSTPEEGNLSEKLRSVLKVLVSSIKVTPVIISGRSLENLRDHTGVIDINLVGDHGVEIVGPLLEFTHHEAEKFREFLEGVTPEISLIVSQYLGAFVEIKPYTLSVHYRLLSPKNRKSLLSKLRNFLRPLLEKELCRKKWGKEILNMIMPFDWDKGHAFSLLFDQFKNNHPNQTIVPIYIGDDITDEDAFRVSRIDGYAVRVGKPKKNTLANYYIASPDEVESFLFDLSEWLNDKNIPKV
jgi:trehalose-phosphatase